MPFASKEQRGYLWAKKPDLAKKWTEKYGAKVLAKGIAKTAKRKRKERKVV